MTAVALSTSARPDLAAAAPRPRAALVANASLLARHKLTPTLARFTVRPDGGALPFLAGQYVQVRLMASPAPPRPYSIASQPGARDLDLLVSLVDGGALSPRLFELPLGSRLFVGAPTGRFRLDHDDPRDHLLVATGSGIAPLLSMVAELGTRRELPRTMLLHGVRTEAELAGRIELDQLDGTWLTYRPILSRPGEDSGWQGLTGRIGLHLQEILFAGGFDPHQTVAYLCGNPSMIAECDARLQELGTPGASIRTERFTDFSAS